jgi:hypothetical protein
LAVLAAFVVGIATGVFVNGDSAPLEPTKTSAVTAASLRLQDVRTKVNDARGADQMADEVAGAALLSRISTVLANADESARHREWLNLLPLLTSADAEHVRELFRKMKAQGRRFEFEWNTFWPRWGELNGVTAIAEVSDKEAGDMQQATAEMVLRGWATADAVAARAWLAANPSAPVYGSALRGYLAGLAHNDLARATADALALARGRDMGQFVEVLVDEALQQRQLDGMVDWWRTLPDDPNEVSARLAAVAPILSRLAEANPTQAQTWLTELAATPYRTEESIGSFAEKLAEKDPAAAAAWVTSLPPSADGHYTGIGRTVRAWAAMGKLDLDHWVASLAPSPLRDQAVAAQQEQSLVSTDLVEAQTQFDRAIRVFTITRGSQIQTLRLQNGSVEIREGK